MYNRFEISPEIFERNHSIIFDRLMQFKRTGYKQVFHIIIPNINPDKLGSIINNYYGIGSNIKIYNNYVNIESELDLSNVNTLSYLVNVKYTDNIDILNRYYTQSIEGWSAKYPTTNFIVVLDDKFDMKFKHSGEFIGNFLQPINVPKLKNIFIGEHGKCSNCLNCMCDFSKTFGTIFLIDPDECKTKSNIKNIVSKEVKEVTREEYAKIMEALAELHRDMRADHDVFSEIISEVIPKDGE